MDIPLFKIYWEKDDVEAVKEIIESGKYWATGPQIEEFEEKIADYLGVDHCLVFNSGGTALFSLMKAYEVEEGDEIIVPSFSFIATAYTPMYVNAKPVFADVEKETFGLDPEKIKAKINKNTKAIMPIHYGGCACQIEEIKEIAEENDLLLIEDAAESFGAKYNDKFVGTFGDASIFSFCHNKVFTTGEGGCVVTDDQELKEELELIRSYGRKTEGDYFTNPENLDYVKLGHNFRMPTMSAALGISQLDKVDKTIGMRREKAQYLNQNLKEIEEIVVPEEPTEKHYNVYQMYTIRVKDNKKRDELMQYLKEKGITTRVYFKPIHRHSVFKDLNYSPDLPNTKTLTSQVLTLPLYPEIEKEKMDFMIKTVKGFFENYENK